jgi:PKD repeat protein
MLVVALVAGCALFANQKPIARIVADVLSGESPLVVTFSALGSSDPDGSIVSYAWDFGGNDTDTGMTVQRTFVATTETRIFTAKLTVTDDEGAQATTEQSIEVRVGGEDGPGTGGEFPTARFDVDAFIGVAPLRVAFDAAGSNGGVGGIIAYNWDFGDDVDAKGVEVTHTFNPEETEAYTVTLFVWDNGNNVDAEQKTIIAIVPENDTGDEGPEAEVTLTEPDLIYESEARPDVPSLFEVSFDPRGSVSAAGHRIEYFAWDFGDGEFQVETNNLEVTHIYELRAPTHTYIATLTVYDDQGEEDKVAINVTLTDN